MQWIVDNWLILLLGGGVVAMHLFGFGHGGHGRGGKKPNSTDDHAAHGHEPGDADSVAGDGKPPASTGSSNDRRT